MSRPIQSRTDPVTDGEDDSLAWERAAILTARDSLSRDHVLSGADAGDWLDGWTRGEEPPVPDFETVPKRG